MTDSDNATRSQFRLPGPARSGSSVHVILPLTCEVSERVNETITNATGHPEYNNFSTWWDYKYQIRVDKVNCGVTVTVRLKVTGASVTSAQKDAWKQAIENRWNNKAVLSCSGCLCPSGLPITISIQYVDSGEHYTVVAQPSGTQLDGRGGRGGGTTGMNRWGVNETVDITHEFGHMLGNVEEYFTTNGVDYTYGGTKQGFSDPDGGIMNNSANDPKLSNYETIRNQVQKCMGGGATCSTGAPGTPPPAPPGSANA